MFLWVCFFASAFWLIRLLSRRIVQHFTSRRREATYTELLVNKIASWQDMIRIGRFPDFKELETKHFGISQFLADAIHQARQNGGEVLPVLERFGEVVRFQSDCFKRANSSIASPLGQSFVGIVILVVVYVTISIVVPSVWEKQSLWIGAAVVSFTVSLLGVGWLHQIAESAAWGGLAAEKRQSILISQIVAEKILASIRAGHPSDQSWMRSMVWLQDQDEDLALRWGIQFWEESSENKESFHMPIESKVCKFPFHVREAMKASIVDGMPVLDRIEASVDAFRFEVAQEIDRSISKIGTRALKPLYLCQLPAILGIFWIGVADAIELAAF